MRIRLAISLLVDLVAVEVEVPLHAAAARPVLQALDRHVVKNLRTVLALFVEKIEFHIFLLLAHLVHLVSFPLDSISLHQLLARPRLLVKDLDVESRRLMSLDSLPDLRLAFLFLIRLNVVKVRFRRFLFQSNHRHLSLISISPLHWNPSSILNKMVRIDLCLPLLLQYG